MIDLVELSRVQHEAIAMLSGLQSPAAIVETLRPRREDYARVFKPDVAARVATGYDELWTSPPSAFGKPGQTEVLARACRAELFASSNDLSEAFPGGYRKIAHLLQPGIVWVAFKYVEPGKTTGMSYDGLARIGDRWGWFPKPWRLLLESDTAN